MRENYYTYKYASLQLRDKKTKREFFKNNFSILKILI